jgi:hypothetical protein
MDVFIFVSLSVATIWFLLYWVGRLNEHLLRRKTLRRMNDIGNMYFDYNHKIWVQKIQDGQPPSNMRL